MEKIKTLGKEYLVDKLGVSPEDADRIIGGIEALVAIIGNRTGKAAEQAGHDAASRVITADDAERIIRGEE